MNTHIYLILTLDLSKTKVRLFGCLNIIRPIPPARGNFMTM